MSPDDRFRTRPRCRAGASAWRSTGSWCAATARSAGCCCCGRPGGALWLAAEGVPPLWPLVVFTAGVWLTRSAGCVINDYADRWLDPQVERTKRPPAGDRRGVAGARRWLVFAVLMLVAFALVLTLNRLTVYLSVVGVLLAASYPYLKRYTYLPQVYLGLAFGWGIPMAFAAVQRRGAAAGVAAVRGQHPLGHRLRHLVRDGRPRRRPAHGREVHRDPVRRRSTWSRRACCTPAVPAALVLVGQRAGLGLYYWAGVAVAALLVALASSRSRAAANADGCFRAFLHNHWVGAGGVRRHRARSLRARLVQSARSRPPARRPTHRPAARRRARRHARARACRVAPVVITSSTSATCAGSARAARDGERAAQVAPARAGIQLATAARWRARARSTSASSGRPSARPAAGPVPAPGRSRARAGARGAAAPAPARPGAAAGAQRSGHAAAPAARPAARSRWNLKRGSSRSSGNA